MKMLRTIHLVLCPKAWNCNRHVILLEKLCNNSVSPIGKIKLEVFTNYTCAFIMMVWIKIEVTDNNIHQIFKVYIPTPWTYPSCQHTHPSSGHTYPMDIPILSTYPPFLWTYLPEDIPFCETYPTPSGHTLPLEWIWDKAYPTTTPCTDAHLWKHYLAAGIFSFSYRKR